MKQAAEDVNASVIEATSSLWQIKAAADCAGALLLHECKHGESDAQVVSARAMLDLIAELANRTATDLSEVHA